MSPDTMFQIANPFVLIGWVALLASPWMPNWADRIASLIVPLVLSVAYAGLILAFWSSGQGGFDSLQNVALLFQSPWLLLAGWIHYLAFDLFVGAWVVRTAREEGVAFWMVVPCLVLTFLFGPAGFLVFNAIRAARRQAFTSTKTA
jgi:hypothetical protein